MLVELFFRLRIVLVALTNLDFEKNKNFSLSTLGILREILVRFVIKSHKHSFSYCIAYTHVTKVIFSKRFAPQRVTPKTITQSQKLSTLLIFIFL